jgi:hypothetical protein
MASTLTRLLRNVGTYLQNYTAPHRRCNLHAHRHENLTSYLIETFKAQWLLYQPKTVFRVIFREENSLYFPKRHYPIGLDNDDAVIFSEVRNMYRRYYIPHVPRVP